MIFDKSPDIIFVTSFFSPTVRIFVTAFLTYGPHWSWVVLFFVTAFLTYSPQYYFRISRDGKFPWMRVRVCLWGHVGNSTRMARSFRNGENMAWTFSNFKNYQSRSNGGGERFNRVICRKSRNPSSKSKNHHRDWRILSLVDHFCRVSWDR